MNGGDFVDDVLDIDSAMTRLELRRLTVVYRLVLEARETVGARFAERSVCEELRLARRVNRGECVGVVELAVALHERFPELLSCLDEGLLDQYRAGQACEVLYSLTAEQADTALARIVERLRQHERPFDWRAYVRRVADAVAPEAKQARVTRQRDDRWARFDPGPDGAGMLLAQLPNEVLAECGSLVEATARSRRADGDARTLDQLRADTPTTLLLGGGSGNGKDDTGISSRRNVGTRVVLNVHVELGTVLHLDGRDATIDGYGPIPAEVARGLLHDPDNVIRKVLTDPDTGTVVGLGRRRYRPSARQRDYVRARDRHCRMPGCMRPIAEIDHVRPWQRSGRTDQENLQGLCRRDHRMKELHGWEHRIDQRTADIVVTTPTGRCYHSEPESAPF